jgi:cobalt-zinc-cadmium resistance protein CzcA
MIRRSLGRPGVAGVDAIGGYVKQYHVQPDPAKLIALGLSFGDIARAIEANNLSRGATTIEQHGEGYVVRATGRVETADEIAEIAIATRASVPIRVKDVAEAGRCQTRTGSASEQGNEAGNGADADRREQPRGGRRSRRQDRRGPRTLPPDIEQTVLNRTGSSTPPSPPWRPISGRALLVIAVVQPLFPRRRHNRLGDPVAC